MSPCRDCPRPVRRKRCQLCEVCWEIKRKAHAAISNARKPDRQKNQPHTRQNRPIPPYRRELDDLSTVEIERRLAVLDAAKRKARRAA